MKTSGDFHEDLAKDLRSPKFKVLFEKEKERLKLVDKLRSAFQRSSLSIRKLASMMGTSKSQVERMISDPKANIGIDILIKFATVLGRKVVINLK